MNPAVTAIAQKMNDVFRSGNFVRQSRAGVLYHVPFSRRMQFIQPGRPTSDGRIYRQAPLRGYLLRAE